ncbi:LysR family transcriptional regulator [Polycladidibacter hongkongensis]|uniref:LysR family transcriptional regulator n=1 Tax=Polycladidibacter hongkongensis TaxID=1647556 RepID=UPI00082D2CDF|nr:LysR family transcriptional regulator [Pseudovibrio hongkongensis]
MANLTEMEIFARVVTAGGMSAAARELGISPAVVSKRLSKLEARLGTRLMQRTTRQFCLTEAGRGYYERILPILDLVEEAESFVCGRTGVARGVLRVSAPTSFGRLHIAPFVGEFLQENPELSLELDLSDRFVDIVGEGYDAAIRVGELSDSSLVARKLAPIHRVLCAAPTYLATAGPVRNWHDLCENHTCLAAVQQDLWRLNGPDGPVSFQVHDRLRTNSSEVVRSAVLAGAGVALRSTWDVGEELRSGALQVVLPDYRNSEYLGLFGIYPSRQFVPVKLRIFLDFLAKKYAPEPYWDAQLEALEIVV